MKMLGLEKLEKILEEKGRGSVTIEDFQNFSETDRDAFWDMHNEISIRILPRIFGLGMDPDSNIGTGEALCRSHAISRIFSLEDTLQNTLYRRGSKASGFRRCWVPYYQNVIHPFVLEWGHRVGSEEPCPPGFRGGALVDMWEELADLSYLMAPFFGDSSEWGYMAGEGGSQSEKEKR